MQKSISVGVTFGIFITIALIVIGFVIGINNKGIAFEEAIKANYSNIDKELQRKYSVFTNMVDAIQSYNKYESETLAKIIEARKSGDVSTGSKLISALAERYPELKSNDNYKTYMTEISITSNRIANYVEVYNKSIQDYNSWARKFPVSAFYSKQNFETYKNPNSDKEIDGKLFK